MSFQIHITGEMRPELTPPTSDQITDYILSIPHQDMEGEDITLPSLQSIAISKLEAAHSLLLEALQIIPSKHTARPIIAGLLADMGDAENALSGNVDGSARHG